MWYFGEKARQRNLEKMVRMGLDHGVSVYYQVGSYGLVSKNMAWSWPNVGDHSPTQRQNAAKKTLDAFVKSDAREVRKALKCIKKALNNTTVSEHLYGMIESQTLAASKSEAFTELFRATDDNHPAFARIASATSTKVIDSILKETKKELARLEKELVE